MLSSIQEAQFHHNRNRLKQGTDSKAQKFYFFKSPKKQRLSQSQEFPWGTKLHIIFESKSSKPLKSNRGKMNSHVCKKSITATSQSEPSACYHQFKGHTSITKKEKTEQRDRKRKISMFKSPKKQAQSKASACLPWGTKLHLTLPESDSSKPLDINSGKL